MTATAFAHPAEPWVEADLDALPNDGNRYEIIDGRLIVTPPANDHHGARQGRVFAMLLSALPKEYDVVVECGIRMPGGNVVADVAVLHPYARRGVVWRDDARIRVRCRSVHGRASCCTRRRVGRRGPVPGQGAPGRLDVMCRS